MKGVQPQAWLRLDELLCVPTSRNGREWLVVRQVRSDSTTPHHTSPARDTPLHEVFGAGIFEARTGTIQYPYTIHWVFKPVPDPGQHEHEHERGPKPTSQSRYENPPSAATQSQQSRTR